MIHSNCLNWSHTKIFNWYIKKVKINSFFLFTNFTHLDCTIITSTTNKLWASSGYLTWIYKCCVTFQLFNPLPNFNIPECNSFVSGCCDKWAAIFTSNVLPSCFIFLLTKSTGIYKNIVILNVLHNILILKKNLNSNINKIHVHVYKVLKQSGVTSIYIKLSLLSICWKLKFHDCSCMSFQYSKIFTFTVHSPEHLLKKKELPV